MTATPCQVRLLTLAELPAQALAQYFPLEKLLEQLLESVGGLVRALLQRSLQSEQLQATRGKAQIRSRMMIYARTGEAIVPQQSTISTSGTAAAGLLPVLPGWWANVALLGATKFAQMITTDTCLCREWDAVERKDHAERVKARAKKSTARQYAPQQAAYLVSSSYLPAACCFVCCKLPVAKRYCQYLCSVRHCNISVFFMLKVYVLINQPIKQSSVRDCCRAGARRTPLSQRCCAWIMSASLHASMTATAVANG